MDVTGAAAGLCAAVSVTVETFLDMFAPNQRRARSGASCGSSGKLKTEMMHQPITNLVFHEHRGSLAVALGTGWQQRKLTAKAEAETANIMGLEGGWVGLLGLSCPGPVLIPSLEGPKDTSGYR